MVFMKQGMVNNLIQNFRHTILTKDGSEAKNPLLSNVCGIGSKEFLGISWFFWRMI